MRFFSTLFLCCVIICCTRNRAGAQHVLHGVITDKDGTVQSYASVLLQQLPDSAIVLTTIADSLGNYKIDAAKLTKTFVAVQSPGHVPTMKTVADPSAAVQELDFILEKDNVELKEVSVSARKPLIERKVDRVIFNVENSIASIGGNALDVLGKAPGVRVTSTDDIALAGKSTVSVMLNDKLLELSGEELSEVLQAIPSGNISRIEVITTPPAKYDAAGNSGIINIVTKKIMAQGLNGSVGGSYLQNSLGSFMPSGTFNYRNGKWNLYGTANGGDIYAKPVEQQTVYYPGEQLNQVNHIDNLHNFYWSQWGADYNVTPKAVIGVLYTYAGSKPVRSDNINGQWIGPNNNIDSIVNTKAHTHDFGERNVANINYEWKIDSTGKKLNADGDFFTRTGRTVRDFTTVDMLGDGTPTGISSTDKTTGEQVLYIGSAKADMELPTKFAKLSFGGKASFIHVISDNVFEYLDSGYYKVDPTNTNKFDYKENTQAAYVSAQKKINKQWDAQAGLRAEYTQTDATSITLNQSNVTKYLKLFPTAYVQYTADENDVFNLNFSRRIERPNMLWINPFRRYLTPTSYSEGNPFLQPSFTSNAELSYTLQSKYTFTMYGQQTQQNITQLLAIDSTTKSYHMTYGNIGTSFNYGITTSASLMPTKWWETSAQLNAFRAHVTANYYNTAVTNQYELSAFVVENDNTFTLNSKKTLLAEAGFEYNSTMIESYNYHYPNYNINMGMKILLLQRNLTIGFNLSDIFRTDIVKLRNLYNQSVTNDYYDERSLHLNATYKFGNKNIKSKRDRTGGAADESKRM